MSDSLLAVIHSCILLFFHCNHDIYDASTQACRQYKSVLLECTIQSYIIKLYLYRAFMLTFFLQSIFLNLLFCLFFKSKVAYSQDKFLEFLSIINKDTEKSKRLLHVLWKIVLRYLKPNSSAKIIPSSDITSKKLNSFLYEIFLVNV